MEARHLVRAVVNSLHWLPSRLGDIPTLPEHLVLADPVLYPHIQDVLYFVLLVKFRAFPLAFVQVFRLFLRPLLRSVFLKLLAFLTRSGLGFSSRLQAPLLCWSLHHSWFFYRDPVWVSRLPTIRGYLLFQVFFPQLVVE